MAHARGRALYTAALAAMLLPLVLRERALDLGVAPAPTALFDLQQVWLRRDRLDYGVKLEGALNLAPPISELSSLN